MNPDGLFAGWTTRTGFPAKPWTFLCKHSTEIHLHLAKSYLVGLLKEHEELLCCWPMSVCVLLLFVIWWSICGSVWDMPRCSVSLYKQQDLIYCNWLQVIILIAFIILVSISNDCRNPFMTTYVKHTHKVFLQCQVCLLMVASRGGHMRKQTFKCSDLTSYIWWTLLHIAVKIIKISKKIYLNSLQSVEEANQNRLK
jgi:hypothetical protein